jgi:hypothetical protein
MSARNFNTQNDTYRQLMGNGLTYRIPRFQRDYSWGEDEWEDLWLDILGTVKDGGEPAHYMGYLVLQSVDEKTFDVIDGQQQLTTMSLIVIAALKNLQRLIDKNKDADSNRRRLEQMRNSYIGFLDPVTLVPRSKLTLNRNNDTYFQTYIVPMLRLPQRGFKATEHQLRKAFEWFERKVREYLKGTSGDEGKAIATLVERMSDRLFFTVINVTDELNAYKVFATLNARGVRLSATDLLKNYLFSVLHREGQHEHEMKSLEDRWEGMVGRLGSESFPDFLRIHWNSRKSLVRKTELFKVIRGQVQTREQAFLLIREMEEDVDPYLALSDPEGSLWPPVLKSLAATLRTFNVRQPFSMLLAARRRFQDAEFEAIFRAIVAASFRYNVIGNLGTSEQERAYSQGAIRLARGEADTVTKALALLAPIYPDDATFKASFAEKTIRTTEPRNRRVVRYILCAIEKHLSGTDHDFASESFNIEHILPQNPEAGWDQFTDEQAEAMVYRLGNMTLMETGPNRDSGNEPFGPKKAKYAESVFSITKKVAEDNAEWNPERIAARQNWMAKQATAIWRVAQLS